MEKHINMLMKNKWILILVTLLLTVACKEHKSVEEVTEELEEKVAEENDTINNVIEEIPVLLGEFTRDTLEANPYNTWFIENYKAHSLDESSLLAVKENIKDVRVTVFMGSWCEDSQREVPAFFKILDEIDYGSDSVNLIMVSEDKEEPADLVKDKQITNVPTFIFTKDGEELGRIVEYPLESLEKDMVKILTGEDYTHAYAE
ncbi:thioredoxin family protein [Dokdonia sp. Hel_I_53]|uniref:thioredoxin family protein n=1 Tax=Dokdonia sp. Hel_I_53 TaxID=1566287 RepID=UPI0011999EE0|nr:thioredoxin family protein [Dokdonia sp. Hel_I_53]TVZ53010.1 thioredoxin-like protein [Dokdonia sp. Hel_I_53]